VVGRCAAILVGDACVTTYGLEQLTVNCRYRRRLFRTLATDPSPQRLLLLLVIYCSYTLVRKSSAKWEQVCQQQSMRYGGGVASLPRSATSIPVIVPRWVAVRGHAILVCNQPSRPTQPPTPDEMEVYYDAFILEKKDRYNSSAGKTVWYSLTRAIPELFMEMTCCACRLKALRKSHTLFCTLLRFSLVFAPHGLYGSTSCCKSD